MGSLNINYIKQILLALLVVSLLLVLLIICNSTPRDLNLRADDNTLIKYKSKLSVW